MYYCTEHGKVKGQLQISQSRIKFSPLLNCDENIIHGPESSLRKFKVCIDMGDVISAQKKTLINESGSYVTDPDGLKSYMYDFFLQIDLAAVTRKNEDPFEEDKNQGVQALDQPSFMNARIGDSFSDNDNSYIQQHANFKEFMQNHALSSLSKARPVATVFFRFSHRNEHDDFLTVNEQKIAVNATRTTILDCQKNHALRLVEHCMDNQVEEVKNSISQTSLQFYDVYSMIDQQAMSEGKKNQSTNPGDRAT